MWLLIYFLNRICRYNFFEWWINHGSTMDRWHLYCPHFGNNWAGKWNPKIPTNILSDALQKSYFQIWRLTPPKKETALACSFSKTALRAFLILGGSRKLIMGPSMVKIWFELERWLPPCWRAEFDTVPDSQGERCSAETSGSHHFLDGSKLLVHLSPLRCNIRRSRACQTLIPPPPRLSHSLQSLLAATRPTRWFLYIKFWSIKRRRMGKRKRGLPEAPNKRSVKNCVH